jgi:hypothetical protein
MSNLSHAEFAQAKNRDRPFKGPDRPAASETPPVKTPNPSDPDPDPPPAEVPKVGSQDAPGG